jgi:hypothetical protein
MHTSQGRPGQPAALADATARASAEPTLAQQRMAICKQCPERRPFGVPPVAIEICGRCGCPLASKTKFPRATCPLAKW